MLNPEQQVEFVNGVREGIMKDHIALHFSRQQEKYGWVYRNLCETNTWYSSGHRTKSKREVGPKTCVPPALAHTCLWSISLQCILNLLLHWSLRLRLAPFLS